jgi:putative colanic acid biosynthesis UDP-glucose lipid carrier transferase
MISPTTRPVRSAFPAFQIAVDFLILAVSYVGIAHLQTSTTGLPPLQTVFLAALGFVVAGEFLGVFNTSHHRPADYDILLISGAWLAGFSFAVFAGFLLNPLSEPLSSNQLVLWFLMALLFVLLFHMLGRGLFAWMSERGWSARRCAILGNNPLGQQLADAAAFDRDLGLSICGIFDDNSEGASGDFKELLSQISKRNIDTVFIAEPIYNEQKIKGWVDRLADTTASVYLVPNILAFDHLYSRWGFVGGHTVVSIFETPIYGVDGCFKRAFDVVFSILGLILSAPIMAMAALAIKLNSAGPILFRQRRYGLDGQEILVWKFRTMTTMDDGKDVKQATRNDPRVTEVGRFLRRTSLDELPQLFNVLSGSMSLVGPRPYAVAHNEQFRSLIRGYMLRHKVKPGITGLAQVLGSRLETDTVEKMRARIELDHRYIRDWSLWLDLKIMVKTIAVVLRQEAH